MAPFAGTLWSVGTYVIRAEFLHFNPLLLHRYDSNLRDYRLPVFYLKARGASASSASCIGFKCNDGTGSTEHSVLYSIYVGTQRLSLRVGTLNRYLGS